jgi:hypothetical protein
VVGLLEEAGVDLHLPGQHRPEVGGHIVPGWDFRVPLGQFGVLGDHPKGLLAGEGLLAQLVPAGVELPLYLSDQALGTWCGAWVAPGAKYMKNGLSAAALSAAGSR